MIIFNLVHYNSSYDETKVYSFSSAELAKIKMINLMIKSLKEYGAKSELTKFLSKKDVDSKINFYVDEVEYDEVTRDSFKLNECELDA